MEKRSDPGSYRKAFYIRVLHPLLIKSIKFILQVDASFQELNKLKLEILEFHENITMDELARLCAHTRGK
jgi:hypothetical protein